MKTLILIYFSIGVLMNLFGPLSKKMSKEIDNVKKPYFPNLLVQKPSVALWEKVLFEFVLRSFVLIFYPLLYIIITVDYFRSKRKIDYSELKHFDDNRLYYWKMGGAGILECNNCDFQQEIVSFLHGHGPNSWNNSGFQCQKCGKFHEIEYDMNNSGGKSCICGGMLSKDKPLYCPNCKTDNVRYLMSFIT